MKQLYKFSLNSFLTGTLGVAMLFTQTWKTDKIAYPPMDFRSSLTGFIDTIPVNNADTIKKPSTDTTGITFTDTTGKQKVDTFILKLSKDSLDAPVKYAAEDSAVVLVKEKKILLYGKTKTEYKDITLTAPKVELDQQTQVVTAYNLKDSLGQVIETAHFKQGENEFSSDTIRYNFKTQVGLTKNTYSQQGEFYVQGEAAKKVDANTTFIKRARFTTCNLDEPHFAFLAGRMKVVNQKVAVSGPAHPEFEGVPVPIYVPFGFYPLSQGRHSGFLPPQFTTNDQYGLGLEGLGYYKVLSDYWDVKLYGNIYSFGGWSANINPSYRKRYRYAGAFNLSIQSTHQNFKGDPDFFASKTYFVTWNHTVDSRARPGTTFSASVNAGSTRYNKLIPNSPQLNFNNQLGSSIAYSKSWAGKPYHLTLALGHDQNNLSHLINVRLPDAGFTVNTLYPFQKKDFVGTEKWWQKLGIGYNGTLRNQFSFYDTAFDFKRILDTLQWGAQHSVPVTVALPALFGGALIVAPSISYSQVWIAQKFRRKWNPVDKKVDSVITKGLYTDHALQFGIGLNTAVFGTYQFKKSRVLAIRHVMRPALSFNYRPDLSKQHFYWVQVDTLGFEQRFTEFEGSLNGGYAEGQVGGISFQFDNNLEMKTRPKNDTTGEGIKKIRLVDGFGFTTGYNFLQDSLKLYPFNLYFRTNLFEKINLSANATLDPYQTNERGQDINKYAWEGGKFKPGRISTGSISLSTSFRSKPKDPKKEEDRKKFVQDQLNDPNLAADQSRLLDYMRQNPSEFVDFNVPWQISLSYSLFFREVLKPDYSGFKPDFSSNVRFDGSFSLTPKWNFSMSGYYDFDTKKLQTFQLSINREMHCWQMSLSVTPIGLTRYFSFSLSPKSAILQDLKINRTRYFTTY
jgi:LPS-assembly protein